MAKKDFSKVNTERVYTEITEATQEPGGRKPRKTYTPEELQAIEATGATRGRKGASLPRINMAFSPEVYDYLRIMSRGLGMTYTDFVNHVLKDHMEKNQAAYKEIIDMQERLAKKGI